MAQNVVAVPKSIIIIGFLCFSKAATAFTILSAPTSLGLSYFILIPVFIPGPTTIGSLQKHFLTMFSKECIILGTTEEIIIPSTSSGFNFA